MTSFLDAALAYPTMIYTALLGLVLFYWLLAIVGLVDFESGGLEIDADLQADVEVGDLGTLAGFLVALGINGVPFSIVETDPMRDTQAMSQATSSVSGLDLSPLWAGIGIQMLLILLR